MTEGVVDRLEVVDVDEEHADRLADPARPDQLLFDAVLEQPAVGQPGQGVVPGHVRDLLEQLEVLEGGGGLVGQPGQSFVEVGVPVDGRRGTVAEVGGQHAEELTGGEERGDHRSLRVGVDQESTQVGVVDVLGR